LILLALVQLLGPAAAVAISNNATSACGYWPGWSGVKNIFSFGDSYTATGFLSSGAQPSLANPLGNPLFPGFTSSDGPNWIGYLVTKYNASSIFSYNLAYGGATVDTSLAKPFMAGVHSLKDQVNRDYMPVYGSGPKRTVWNSNDSLFTFWIGINDVLNVYYNPDTTLIPSIFAEYSTLIETAYASGARNFLLIDVPAIQYSPNAQFLKAAALLQETNAIQNWATRLATMAKNLQTTHPDVTVTVFSAYGVFQRILSGPTAYQQTQNLKALSGYCPAYANGTLSGQTFVGVCTVPVNQYFWLNTLHPTYPVHDALGFTISTALTGVPQSTFLCSA